MNYYEQELKILNMAEYELDSNSYAELNLDTEQVLTGLATLTARIREEMAETENEIAKDFVESVAPELLLPLPARGLAEIIPSPADNLKREIPCGSLLMSKKMYFWRTIGNHNLNPEQRIISVKAMADSDGFDCLEFESKGSGPWIIFINGESEFAWGLWHFILEHAKPYVIAKPENPWELCRDFFCFEDKFRYIYMENLPEKLRFAKKIPRDIFSKICTDNFKLNVLPIENAYEQNLEPVLLDNEIFETKIFPNEEKQIILSLKEVLAGDMQKADLKKIEHRYNSGKIRFANLPPNANMLSITAIVCDETAAGTLEQNSVLQAKNSAMQMCEIRSAIKALPFLRPPLAEWEILGLLQKNYMQFFEGDTLKNALEMQIWNAQGKQNYLAQSIKSVSVEHHSAVHKGCLVPVAYVKIVLSLDFFNINNYGFIGILKAYGEMLFYLFKKIFICNMLVKLILRIEPFGMELKWE